ncbi:SGNH hydrolase-type esterase domain-containing protein [Artemisia annua]|uniref:SGNH hydrolase-type esterase domain-containing protein n=1 Tax=Artemisia annua TaxID=35608 RepID=A0A2U1QEL9_ARTAN|nr:SGNH hydrolase-type esterase domain-containing protein [Artemisia annua]
MEFKRLSCMEDDLFTYDPLMSYTEDELLLLWPIIESKGLVWTTIEEKERKFQIEYMNSTNGMTKSSNQSCDIQPMQPSYMPYSELYWGLDKNNLDDERIYAESEILFHRKLIRLMDISLEEWLELKYGDPEFAPMDEVKRIVTSWLTRSFKEQFNEFMEIRRKMIGNTSFDVNYDPNDVDFSDWLASKFNNHKTMDRATKNVLWIYWVRGEDEEVEIDHDSSWVIHIVTLAVVGEPQVPCYFIFGDSLVDSGNNNKLATAAKANYRPYGINFPQGVTGRFTNGRTLADIIGQLLGFATFIPPYATATDQEISTGVNYGSGSAGIREESGSHLVITICEELTPVIYFFIIKETLARRPLDVQVNSKQIIYLYGGVTSLQGDRISLDRQLLNHETTISRLSVQSNKTYTAEHLKKCIYLANIGSNDYINNYLIPNIYPTSNIYTVDEYAAVLVQEYSEQLKTLYNLGARKVAVFGLGQIGCTPAEIAKYGTNGKPCVEWIDDAVKLFDEKLMSLINKLNNDCSDARFTFINITSISAPQGQVPIQSYPCCQVGEDGQCVPNSTPCDAPAYYIFYDGFHPTELANDVVALRSYTAEYPMDSSPYDISHLARL